MAIRTPADPARQRAYRLGWRAEALCALALRLKGYRILARRYRAPGGEVDIVARRGATLAFVEVKARPTLAAALDTLTPRQRARVERAARAWLAGHPYAVPPDALLRFDLMALRPRRWPRHVPDAWEPRGWW